jgi:hypothetical protein
MLFIPLCALSGAEITVPRMEVSTRGAMEDGEFRFSTNSLMDIALNGGYKYGILLGFSLESADLGKALAYGNFRFNHWEPANPGTPVTETEYNGLVDQMNERMANQAYLSFRIVKATARDLFNQPLDFSFFMGYSDVFCSGEEFVNRYGLFSVPTDFTGFFYLPEGIGGDITRRYDGIHGARGTGFSLALTRWANFIPMVYAYQDFSFFDPNSSLNGKNHYSGDLRFILNLERLKIEAFTGFTSAIEENTEVRGGMLAFFTSGKGMDFLFQAGVPGWTYRDKFTIDNLYFLIEPRLNFTNAAFHVSFFYHPLWYQHIESAGERGKADVNLKFLAGNIESQGLQGGLESTFGLRVTDRRDSSIKLSPLISFFSSGLRWDMKLRMDLLRCDRPAEMFEFFVGLRTAY